MHSASTASWRFRYSGHAAVKRRWPRTCLVKVAVVGGGIFGVTAAVHAALAGHETHLYEALPDIMSAASGVNQYRLHRGYHYPRSSDTARATIDGEKLFRDEYGAAVVDDGRHLYAIARESRVDAAHCFAFFKAHDLAYREVTVPEEFANTAEIETVVEVQEPRVDPVMLKALAKSNLRNAGVSVHVGQKVSLVGLRSFDWVVLATYANLNSLIQPNRGMQENYKFQVCEKPVIRMPAAFADTSIVTIDGPFTSVDPYGRSDLHVLGSVLHAVHATNIGYRAQIPLSLRSLLNRGVIRNPPITAFSQFIEGGARYIPGLRKAEHIGSLYTVRTVLPNLEKTDARPTIVSTFDDRYIRIFSGKIGNCVDAARKAVSIMGG